MRQTTLTRCLSLNKGRQVDGVDTLVQLLQKEEELAFHAIIPHGNILKSVSELLMRCAPHVSLTIDNDGLIFLACDPNGGRLIHIVMSRGDMRGFCFRRSSPMRCTLETNSLHAVCPSLFLISVRWMALLKTGLSVSPTETQGHRRSVCNHLGTIRIMPRFHHRGMVAIPGGLLRKSTSHQTLYHLDAPWQPNPRV